MSADPPLAPVGQDGGYLGLIQEFVSDFRAAILAQRAAKQLRWYHGAETPLAWYERPDGSLHDRPVITVSQMRARAWYERPDEPLERPEEPLPQDR